MRSQGSEFRACNVVDEGSDGKETNAKWAKENASEKRTNNSRGVEKQNESCVCLGVISNKRETSRGTSFPNSHPLINLPADEFWCIQRVLTASTQLTVLQLPLFLLIYLDALPRRRHRRRRLLSLSLSLSLSQFRFYHRQKGGGFNHESRLLCYR